MTKIIKFSSDYPKLHGQTIARLINVDILTEVNEDLLEYDTKNSQGEYYKLPKGLLIHLTFLGDKMIPFCTIRRHTNTKFRYYQKAVGDFFEVKIKK